MRKIDISALRQRKHDFSKYFISYRPKFMRLKEGWILGFAGQNFEEFQWHIANYNGRGMRFKGFAFNSIENEMYKLNLDEENLCPVCGPDPRSHSAVCPRCIEDRKRWNTQQEIWQHKRVASQNQL